MTEKEYLLIFEVIIYAGIITQFLLGWSKMIQERGKYKVYWLHLLIGFTIFLSTIQHYYSYRNLSHYDDISSSFTLLIFSIIPLASMFIITFLLFPKSNVDVDFKKMMQFEFRVPYAIFTIVPLVHTSYRNLTWILPQDHFKLVNLAGFVPHFVMIALLIILMFNKSIKYFAFYGVLSFATMFLFMIKY